MLVEGKLLLISLILTYFQMMSMDVGLVILLGELNVWKNLQRKNCAVGHNFDWFEVALYMDLIWRGELNGGKVVCCG